MKRVRPQDLPPAPAENFTGDVRIDVLAVAEAPSQVEVSRVVFAPGARTAWHRHALGQTLYVTEGSGRVQARGSAVAELEVGDTVVSPPGEWHWHGAAPEQSLTHLSIREVPGPDFDGPESAWGELVTDAEYGDS